MGILTRAARNISRRKTRSFFVIVVLSLAIAMLIYVPHSITASKAITQKTIDELTANAKEVNSTVNTMATEIDCHLPTVPVPNSGPNNQTIIEEPLFNLTDYTNFYLIPHITAVIPILNQREYDSNFSYHVYGIPLDNASLLGSFPIVLPSNITAGRNLHAGDSDVVILQEGMEANFCVGVGGTVNILNKTFQVIGVEGYTPLNETAAYMNLNDAQEITNDKGNATGFNIFVDDVNNVQATANKIGIMYPKLSVSIAATLVDSVIQMQTQTNEQLQMAWVTMSQIQSAGNIEIVVIAAVVVATVFIIMLYTVRGRTREIGTFKALGASNLAILGQFMLEGLLLSLLAGVIGIITGSFGVTSLANLLLPHPTQAISAVITPELMLLGLGTASMLGMLGSMYPAWRAAETPPSEAMRHD